MHTLISRKSLTEQNSRLLRLYGKLPARGDLLHYQLDVYARYTCQYVMHQLTGTQSQGREYVDSGDYALSQAHKASDIGRIRTSTEHPLRGSISHPSSPFPSGSNIKDVSTKQEKAVEGRHDAKEASNLHQQTSVDKTESAQ